MLRLWDESMKGQPEAGQGRSLSAPLVPLLRRFQYLQPVTQSRKEEAAPFLPNGSPYSPTECLLRFLKIPASDEVAVDLRQTAVVIMAHLGGSRLSTNRQKDRRTDGPTNFRFLY